MTMSPSTFANEMVCASVCLSVCLSVCAPRKISRKVLNVRIPVYWDKQGSIGIYILSQNQDVRTILELIPL